MDFDKSYCRRGRMHLHSTPRVRNPIQHIRSELNSFVCSDKSSYVHIAANSWLLATHLIPGHVGRGVKLDLRVCSVAVPATAPSARLEIWRPGNLEINESGIKRNLIKL